MLRNFLKDVFFCFLGNFCEREVSHIFSYEVCKVGNTLGGGFKHFSFLPVLEEMIQFDLYFSNGLKPPTSTASFLIEHAFVVKYLCLGFYYCTSFYPKMLAVTNFAQSCKIQALSLMHWCTTFAGVGVGETVLLNQARQHQLMSEYIDSLFLRLTVKNSILICLFETVTLLRATYTKPRLDVSYFVLVVCVIDVHIVLSVLGVIRICSTPWKINMEPEIHLFEKENNLPNLHFWGPC